MMINIESRRCHLVHFASSIAGGVMRSLKSYRMIVVNGLSEYDMTQIRLRYSRLLPWSAEVIVSDSGVTIRGMGGMIVLHGPSIDYYSDDPKDLSWLVITYGSQ